MQERGLEPLSTDDIQLRVLSFAIRDRWYFNQLGKAKNLILIKTPTQSLNKKATIWPLLLECRVYFPVVVFFDEFFACFRVEDFYKFLEFFFVFVSFFNCDDVCIW